MALPEVTVSFSYAPTFNKFDSSFREEWSRLRDKPITKSYGAWGDEALIPLWMNIVSQSIERGDNLETDTLTCIEIMGIEDAVFSGVTKLGKDHYNLYPLPIARLEWNKK